MAIQQAWIMRCDICDGVMTEEQEPVGDTEHEAWQKARDAGWQKNKGRHVCPECVNEID